ncbi:hypothetical protein V5O48_010174 [Marasmius crinis-equi]|uniref:Uncharacterized protein n=1 Tax=Marasmius crinis-equi TaxID=585013 RepID=A0ABR3F945_9AGAR
MAQPQVEVKYDQTGSHILSDKAIKEGWDTFIFYPTPIQRGPLLVGINTRRYQLERSDVGRWLNVMVQDREDEMGPPPMLYRCTIGEGGIAMYLPEEVSGSPIDWNKPDHWETGNYALEGTRQDDFYITLFPPEPVAVWEFFLPPEQKTSPKLVTALFSIEGHTCDGELEKANIYILPDPMKADLSSPDNLIYMPSALKKDFYQHAFSYDCDAERFIIFPDASQTTEEFLSNCILRRTPSANLSNLMKNFRKSLH